MMTKKELKTGDIVVMRDAWVAVVIHAEDDSYLLTPNSRHETLQSYEEDLTYYVDDEDCDIMRVYRADSESLDFQNYLEGDLIFERDANWEIPTEEEIQQEKECNEEERYIAQKVYEIEHSDELDAARKRKEEFKKQCVRVLQYGGYGLGVIDAHPSDFDAYLSGMVSPRLDPMPPIWHSNVFRTCVKIPGYEDVVIMYDKVHEERTLEIFDKRISEEPHPFYKPKRKPLFVIPETGFAVHTWCIACRMNEQGEYADLTEEEIKKLWEYFVLY